MTRLCRDCHGKMDPVGINHGNARCQACIEVREAKRIARNALIVEIRIAEKLSARAIGRRLGCSEFTASMAIKGAGLPPLPKHREDQDDDDDAEAAQTLPRCRCGLLMPCNGCLMPAWAIASHRRAEAA